MSEKGNKTEGLCVVSKIFYENFNDSDKKGGLFGIESNARKQARELEIELIRKDINNQNRGYEGATRLCPACQKKQNYRGDRERLIRFESGEFKVQRAYYVCSHCGKTSVPLDEKLGIVEGREQGVLREKLSLIGVIVSYHQGPEVCKVLLGHEGHATTLRRCVERESERFAKTEITSSSVIANSEDTLYVEIDGHMCPTREERKNSNDQGYREAKVAMVFKESDIANISKERNEVLKLNLRGEIACAKDFSKTVSQVYHESKGDEAGRVVILADGAPWIWNIANDVMPEAIQILDYSHAKSHLWEAADLIYGSKSDLRSAWVKKQKEWLFEDKLDLVINGLKEKLTSYPDLQTCITYLENNKERMRYKQFREQGLMIGSGAIESAGKRLAQGRIKGCGMRWNVADLNNFLKLRCAFLDRSWKEYWGAQCRLAA